MSHLDDLVAAHSSRVRTRDSVADKIREKMDRIDLEYPYGWGAGHDGLPIRPDVYSYVVDTLCRRGLGPMRLCESRFAGVTLDTRGTVKIHIVADSDRALELCVPCHGVVIARQRFAGVDTLIEGRLSVDAEQLRVELATLLEWIEEDA